MPQIRFAEPNLGRLAGIVQGLFRNCSGICSGRVRWCGNMPEQASAAPFQALSIYFLRVDDIDLSLHRIESAVAEILCCAVEYKASFFM